MSKSYNDCLSTRIRHGNATPKEEALADAAPDLLAACREAKSLLLNAGDAAKSDAIADCFVAVVRASTNAIDTLRAAIRLLDGKAVPHE